MYFIDRFGDSFNLLRGEAFVSLFVIDLFAGAGGLTEGFLQAGFTSVCANDFDEQAKMTFTFNHPSVPYLQKDIAEIEPKEILNIGEISSNEVSVITGGPPCQGFSLAGQRLSDDTRNQLFKEYIRITKAIKPKVVFFENVPGIQTMENGKVLQAIMTEFLALGYSCDYRVINAADYGVPQSRPRFVLLGVKGSEKISFPAPTHGMVNSNGINLFDNNIKPYITSWSALSDLPLINQGEGAEELWHVGEYSNDYQVGRKGGRSTGIIYNHRATKHDAKIQYRYSLLPEGCNNSVLPEEIRTKKRNAFKLHRDLPSRTVTCNFRTDLIHPTMNRGLTVREAARLQSFDDDYRFFGNLTRKAKWLTQDDQVGNAVPPILARAFANHIRNSFL